MSVPVAVRLWGRNIGAVDQHPGSDYYRFQYAPEFVGSGIQVAPLTMPLATQTYIFPELSRTSLDGLPGLLADSLPDYFGNALIDAWLAREGRPPGSFGPLDRLCYVGQRGMGALEYEPALGPAAQESQRVEVERLATLAQRVFAHREGMAVELGPDPDSAALTQLLRVGTSAGGARAKAVIAWNPETNEARSGQVDTESGFEHWILKFDGVGRPGETQLGEPLGYGAVEFAYYLMATAAGIEMSECRVLEEGGRRHFMTRRFDRTREGRKLHMQSLAGLAHLDFNQAGAHSYEEALQIIRGLGLPMDAVEEQYRRMVFNVLARNQDDHVKNIAFLMDRQGTWRLSPAFDVTYAYNPSGDWTSSHQMTLAGKRSGFTLEDLREVGRGALLKRGRAEAIYEEVRASVSRWGVFAEAADVEETKAAGVADALRLELPAE